MADTQSKNSGQISCRTPRLADVVSTQIDLEKLPTDNHFPEGELTAWLAVLGGFFSMFGSFGWANAIGVFQDYHETHQLKHLSSSTIGWIASLQLFFMFVSGVFVGRLFDVVGPRYLLNIGALLEGIITLIDAAFIFYTALAAVPTHFHRKRRLAMGLSSSGSSLGSTIVRIMVKKLSQNISYGLTMRACALLILGLLVIVNLTITSNATQRVPKISVQDYTKHFTDIHYVVLVVASMLTFWG
ncbi:major facilitator superfamily domain-containing protein [Lipomyces doorenjongii]